MRVILLHSCDHI